MLEKFSDRLYYLENNESTNRPFLGYVRGDEFSMMLDAGNSPAHVKFFMDAVSKAGLNKPAFAGITHWHWDHSFGISALDIPTIASTLTNEKLRSMADWKWDEASMKARVASGDEIAFSDMNIHNEYKDPGIGSIVVNQADIEFEGVLNIDLGGVHCECHHIGGPHSPDATIFYIPEEKFAFLGDSCGKDLYGLKWSFDPDHLEKLGEIFGGLPFDAKTLKPYVEYMQRLDFENCLIGHMGFYSRNAFFADLLPHI